MNRIAIAVLTAGTFACASLSSQTNTPEPAYAQTTIRVNSRAVLVDVIVTDQHGNAITGLKQSDFSVMEQGKPQSINFFEGHQATQSIQPVEMPKLPTNVFSNFSPFPQPAAVNVLLLDSLNTRMESQSFVHQQALDFLKSAKPGSRMAIFTMGLGLHFIQGFNDDPAVLAAALKNKKNNEVEASVMLKGADETSAQQNILGAMGTVASTAGGVNATAASPGAISSLQEFMAENDASRSFDRMYVTMANLQKLAAFLQGFPGRKNVIWFAEKVPALYVTSSMATMSIQSGNPAMESELKKTLAMLAAARAAIYPVDARGVTVSGGGLYTAQNNLAHGVTQGSQLLGPTSFGGDLGSQSGGSGGFANTMTADSVERNGDQSEAEILARESGGKAFANTNGLSRVMADISANSGNFYTLAYAPHDSRMDGGYRSITVTVGGGNYHLSYRRGYFAVDEALPGSALVSRDEAIRKLAAAHPGEVDPLLPFMDLGMPQSQQILYEAKVQPIPAKDNEPASEKGKLHYKVDFAVDLKDLNLKLGQDGLHTGNLNVSLVVYDRYGNIVSRKDHLIALNIKPDVYAAYQNTGVQLHAQVDVPKGNFWLRTGVFDRNSRKVGTMEIPLSAVKAAETAASQ